MTLIRSTSDLTLDRNFGELFAHLATLGLASVGNVIMGNEKYLHCYRRRREATDDRYVISKDHRSAAELTDGMARITRENDIKVSLEPKISRSVHTITTKALTQTSP